MLRQCVLVWIGLSVFACGGPAAPAEQPEPPPPTEAGAEPSAEAPPEQDIEQQREAFLQSCAKKSRSAEFCNCGFEQFKAVFQGTDLTQPLKADDPRVLELQKRTQAECASKLSEADVRDGFLRGCVGGDERKEPYCACAWSSLTKTLPYTTFIGEVDDAQLAEPKKKMVIECKGKFPPDVAKFDFMSACTKGDSSLEANCSCRWDKLRKQFTTEQIVAGTIDPTTAKGLENCK